MKSTVKPYSAPYWTINIKVDLVVFFIRIILHMKFGLFLFQSLMICTKIIFGSFFIIKFFAFPYKRNESRSRLISKFGFHRHIENQNSINLVNADSGGSFLSIGLRRNQNGLRMGVWQIVIYVNLYHRQMPDFAHSSYENKRQPQKFKIVKSCLWASYDY